MRPFKHVNDRFNKKAPYVFVAMPFSKNMKDVYHYGIRRAIEANGFRCIRIDEIAYSGDIWHRIRTSISTSAAIVVDLTSSNPNVLLELGYALGKDRPTVLLVQEGEELCFDIRGQRCLRYETIEDLEIKLTQELAHLKQMILKCATLKRTNDRSFKIIKKSLHNF